MSDIVDDANLLDQVRDWLRSNGIDPAEVPIGTRASVVDGNLTVELFDRDANGRLQIDPTTDEVAKRTVTVPVIVQPSSAVENWLTPRCPTCGR